MMWLFLAVVGVLPASRAKNLLLRVLGHGVHPSARIAPCVLWRVVRLEVGERSSIGVGNIIRDLQLVHLEQDALIGQFNWISSAFPFVDSAFSAITGRLVLQHGAAITSRHYLDCSGSIVLERFVTVAGVRSTFISHQIDLRTNEQTAAPISIGEFAIIGSNANFVPGASVAPRCLTAMGATIVGRLATPDRVYGGTPAVEIKALDPIGYFSRDRPAVPRRAAPEYDNHVGGSVSSPS